MLNAEGSPGSNPLLAKARHRADSPSIAREISTTNAASIPGLHGALTVSCSNNAQLAVGVVQLAIDPKGPQRSDLFAAAELTEQTRTPSRNRAAFDAHSAAPCCVTNDRAAHTPASSHPTLIPQQQDLPTSACVSHYRTGPALVVGRQ